MTNEELFTKLVAYIDRRFEQQEEKYDQRFDWMYKALDGLITRMDEDDVDRTITAEDIKRHDAWIKQLASKTRTQLSY